MSPAHLSRYPKIIIIIIIKPSLALSGILVITIWIGGQLVIGRNMNELTIKNHNLLGPWPWFPNLKLQPTNKDPYFRVHIRKLMPHLCKHDGYKNYWQEKKKEKEKRIQQDIKNKKEMIKILLWGPTCPYKRQNQRLLRVGVKKTRSRKLRKT